MTKLFNIITKYPKQLIAINIILTIFFLSRFTLLHWETDSRVYFPKGHSAIKNDQKLENFFGFKDSIIVGILNEKETVLNKKTLARISRITEKISMLPEIISIRKSDIASLSTIKTFTAWKKMIESKPLMDKVPVTNIEIESLKKRIIENKYLLFGNLVSADFKAALIKAKIKEGIDQRYEVYFKIKKILQEELPKEKRKGVWSDETISIDNDFFYIAGRPVIEVTSGLYATKDMAIMIPAVMSVIILLIYLIFRNSWGVFLPIYVLLSSVIWTLGFMGLIGAPLYITSIMIPVILLIISTADSIHFICKYFDELDDEIIEERQDILYRVLMQIGSPIILTSLTTAVGFFSLAFIQMPPIREFGIYTGIGILFELFISLTIIPSVLLLLKTEHKRPDLIKGSFYLKISFFMEKFGRFVVGRYKTLFVIISILIVILGFGATKVYIDSTWIGDFKKDSDVFIANKILNEKFTGTVFLNVIFEGKKRDAMKSPKILAKIDALQLYMMSKFKTIGGSLSIVDFIKHMNQIWHEGNPVYRNLIPSSPDFIGQLLYLYFLSPEPDLLDEVIDYNYQRTNLIFAIKTDHTKELKSIIKEVNLFLDRHFSDMKDIEINLAGSANNTTLWTGFLLKGIISGLLFSKIMIFILMSIQYRSFVGGFIGILPISFTTLSAFGIMGIFGIPLDVSTVMATLIAIGVGLDITVHYIFRFQIETKYIGNSYEPATINTFKLNGKAIFFNILVVAIGFLVLGLSNFPPHIKTGYFVSLYLILSFFVAFLSLPVIFKLIKPKFLNKEMFFCPKDEW